MKRIFTIIAWMVVCMSIIAQTNQLVWSNGSLIYGTSMKTIDSLTYGEVDEMDTFRLFLPHTLIKVEQDTMYVHDTIYVEVPSAGTPEGNYEYVDLGLSVKWATCNIGATEPEEYGDYFAWGEVEPRQSYDWSVYKYCNDSFLGMTKYCTVSTAGNEGFIDNKRVLDSVDDVATVNWGEAWRMPTKEEQEELLNKCIWRWTTFNGVNGYAVIGVNRNAIFLPASGCKEAKNHYGCGVYGHYWSSSLFSDISNNAHYMGFCLDDFYGLGNLYEYYLFRYFGLSVRAVYKY